MRTPILGAMAVLAMVAPAAAQTVPDLKGTWSGQWRSSIYGHNAHDPEAATAADAPRVREITFTLQIERQDGRRIRGKFWANPDQKEPFAATVAPGGNKIVGTDADGTLSGTITAPDRLHMCYTRPSKSKVAICGAVQRSR
jgi:hypothetical protein